MTSPGNPVPQRDGAFASLPPNPPLRKSEAIAFLLSFFLPGAGVYYCGKKRAGLWTLGLALLLAVILYVLLWLVDAGHIEIASAFGVMGMFIRASFILCAFAVWDAVETAREVNAGRDRVNRYKPRFAAVLNLLTRGLGYFYIGERRLGLLAFLASLLVSMAAFSLKGIWIGLLVESVAAYFAWDGYIKARKKNPAVPQPSGPHSWTANVWDYANYTYSTLLGIVYAVFAVLAFYILGFHVDQSQARFEVSNGLSTYENPVAGVRLRAPGAWEQGEGATNVFIHMKSSDHSMELIFGALARVPFFTVDRASKEIQKAMGWNGLSVFQQLRWTTEGDPWISTEFCQLLPTPRAVPRGGGAIWEVCEDNARSKILIWRKKKRYYMLILVTVQTQDPTIQSNQLMMSQSLPHVASVD